MPQIEKFGYASATTTLTSAPGSSSRARRAALIPASLPPIMTRCMLTPVQVGRSPRRALGRRSARRGGCAINHDVIGPRFSPAPVVRDDDVGRLRRGDPWIQRLDNPDGQDAADDFSDDEAWHGGRGDAF